MEPTPYLWIAPVVDEETRESNMYNEVGDPIPKLESLEEAKFLEFAKRAKHSDYYFRFGVGYPISLFEIYRSSRDLVLRELDAYEGFEESPSGKYVLLKADRGRYVFEVATGKRVTIQAPQGWLPQGWWNRNGEDIFYVEQREPFGGDPADYHRSEFFQKWKREGRIGAATMNGKLLWELECPWCSTSRQSPNDIQKVLIGYGYRVIDAFGRKSSEWTHVERSGRPDEMGAGLMGLSDSGHVVYQDRDRRPVVYAPDGKSWTLEPLPWSSNTAKIETRTENGWLVLTFELDGEKVVRRIEMTAR